MSVVMNEQQAKLLAEAKEEVKKQKDLSERRVTQLENWNISKEMLVSLQVNAVMFPMRIWILDNSGSMLQQGGQFLWLHGDKDQYSGTRECTRWVELGKRVSFHADLADILNVKTTFMFLNHFQGDNIFVTGDKHKRKNNNIKLQETLVEMLPSGGTPLTARINDVRKAVEENLPSLREGQRISITIATDGIPSDDLGASTKLAKDNFISALKALCHYPVWIVIRLCTLEEEVVEFYQDLNQMSDLPMDVLQDMKNESKLIRKHNKFLNYSLPVHTMREAGNYSRTFDMLNERTLNLDELQELLPILVGYDNYAALPNPEADLKEFLKALSKLNDKLMKCYCIRFDARKKPLDMKGLKEQLGVSKCVIS